MNTVVVFTSKDLDTIFTQGGSGDWVANEDRLSRCTYIVLVANAHSDWSKHSPSKHANAFLVGKVIGTIPAPATPRRVIIQMSEYAEIDLPNSWAGQRNPVRYTDISEFRITPSTLDWKPFPITAQDPQSTVPALTIEEAKLGLAKKLGVTPDHIEIIVRA